MRFDYSIIAVAAQAFLDDHPDMPADHPQAIEANTCKAAALSGHAAIWAYALDGARGTNPNRVEAIAHVVANCIQDRDSPVHELAMKVTMHYMALMAMMSDDPLHVTTSDGDAEVSGPIREFLIDKVRGFLVEAAEDLRDFLAGDSQATPATTTPSMN